MCPHVTCISPTAGRGTRKEARRGGSQRRSESRWLLWRREQGCGSAAPLSPPAQATVSIPAECLQPDGAHLPGRTHPASPCVFQVLQFNTNCPECNAPAQTNMKLVRIFRRAIGVLLV